MAALLNEVIESRLFLIWTLLDDALVKFLMLIMSL